MNTQLAYTFPKVYVISSSLLLLRIIAIVMVLECDGGGI